MSHFSPLTSLRNTRKFNLIVLLFFLTTQVIPVALADPPDTRGQAAPAPVVPASAPPPAPPSAPSASPVRNNHNVDDSQFIMNSSPLSPATTPIPVTPPPTPNVSTTASSSPVAAKKSKRSEDDATVSASTTSSAPINNLSALNSNGPNSSSTSTTTTNNQAPANTTSNLGTTNTGTTVNVNGPSTNNQTNNGPTNNNPQPANPGAVYSLPFNNQPINFTGIDLSVMPTTPPVVTDPGVPPQPTVTPPTIGTIPAQTDSGITIPALDPVFNNIQMFGPSPSPKDGNGYSYYQQLDAQKRYTLLAKMKYIDGYIYYSLAKWTFDDSIGFITLQDQPKEWEQEQWVAPQQGVNGFGVLMAPPATMLAQTGGLGDKYYQHTKITFLSTPDDYKRIGTEIKTISGSSTNSKNIISIEFVQNGNAVTTNELKKDWLTTTQNNGSVTTNYDFLTISDTSLAKQVTLKDGSLGPGSLSWTTTRSTNPNLPNVHVQSTEYDASGTVVETWDDSYVPQGTSTARTLKHTITGRSGSPAIETETYTQGNYTTVARNGTSTTLNYATLVDVTGGKTGYSTTTTPAGTSKIFWMNGRTITVNDSTTTTPATAPAGPNSSGSPARTIVVHSYSDAAQNSSGYDDKSILKTTTIVGDPARPTYSSQELVEKSKAGNDVIVDLTRKTILSVSGTSGTISVSAAGRLNGQDVKYLRDYTVQDTYQNNIWMGRSITINITDGGSTYSGVLTSTSVNRQGQLRWRYSGTPATARLWLPIYTNEANNVESQYFTPSYYSSTYADVVRNL